MKRSDQRRQAVFALYQHDLTGRPLEDLFDGATTDFARALATETLDQTAEIDLTLRRFIKEGWTLERIAPLERNILRVAVHELFSGDVPREVALDEAVELAKRYCSADAPKFVNGILASVLRELPAREDV
jgi:N utilization substance protein B